MYPIGFPLRSLSLVMDYMFKKKPFQFFIFVVFLIPTSISCDFLMKKDILSYVELSFSDSYWKSAFEKKVVVIHHKWDTVHM